MHYYEGLAATSGDCSTIQLPVLEAYGIEHYISQLAMRQEPPIGYRIVRVEELREY